MRQKLLLLWNIFLPFLPKPFEHFQRLIEKSFSNSFCGLLQPRHPNFITFVFKETRDFFLLEGLLHFKNAVSVVFFYIIKRHWFICLFHSLLRFPLLFHVDLSPAVHDCCCCYEHCERGVIQKYDTLSNEVRRSAKRRMHEPDEVVAYFMWPASHFF